MDKFTTFSSRRRIAARVAPIAAFILVLGGCNSGGESASSGKAVQPGGNQEKLTVGIVFDSGGRGDKSFNDSAYAGIERAEKDFGIEVKTVDSKKVSDYPGNLSGIADQGAKVVFAVGITQQEALLSVADKYPDVKFGIVDAVVDKPNVRSLVFSEEQGSFLAGYAAGLVSKSGKIGFVGGMKIPLIEKFEAGYAAGAKYANPSIVVLPAKYTGSWDDTSKGKAAASFLYSDGADIVYHAAGRCGLGVFAAAKEVNGAGPITKYAIGVDSDQDDQEKGIVLTSMVKRVDEAVYQTIKDAVENKFAPGTKSYDLAAGGVGLTDFRNTKDVVGQANLDKIAKVTDLIKTGKLTVPAKLAEIEAFLKSAPQP
jgi:basic membrane protein A